jgi:drug/metabolite transporter (DMT)-like permease
MCPGELGQVRAVVADGALVVESASRTSTVSAMVLDQPVSIGDWVAGSALLIMWVVVTGKGSQLIGMDAHQWAWVAATGVVLAGYVATWLAALAAAPAVNVTAVLVAAVPVTALLKTIVRDAPLRPQLGGLALVMAGCLVVVATMLPLRARRRVAILG